MSLLSLKDLDVKGKRVLMRVDFNVPLNDAGEIVDDTRIQLSLSSIKHIIKEGGKLILMSHFGRPKGKVDPKLSLRPCAERLSSLLGKEVKFATDAIGESAKTMSTQLKEGEVLLLENLRFNPGEENPENHPIFAKELAKLGDFYVNDAFGAAHRTQGSIVTITKYFPGKCAMGFLMEKELAYLTPLITDPNRPFYAIIGGAKIGTKLGVLEALIEKVDGIFIGGGMAFTLFKAQGITIGDSIHDDSMLPAAKEVFKICKEKQVELYLPKDVVIEKKGQSKTILIDEGIPKGWKGLDVGSQTIKAWTEHLKNGATIFWNGPLGVYEIEEFAKGTYRLAETLSKIDATIIIGGGDSLSAVNKLNLVHVFSHLSSGGGAALELIEHGYLPGINALSRH